ncbi:YitT family protein [uncultured Parolsenella sp.]|uniref:YitT family protein n=1 Tax=uncultured Parolsenella sp. TaxID=2083008 RepID=UPI0025F9E65A|nr:YitT family protein [uncultured Parolsenella sp.]
MDRRPSHPVINYALLALGSAIAAFAVEEFLVPNTILDGGVIGVGMMISHVTGIPLALLTVILNAPFVILGGIKLGRSFTARAVFSMATFSACVEFFDGWANATGETLLAVCFGGVLLGLGVGIVIRGGGCLDGTEAVAILVSRKTDLAVGQMVLGMNIIIYGIAGVLFGVDRALYSLLTYFITSKVLDMVESEMNQVKAALIVTDDAAEICEQIYRRMGRTVTIMEGEGMLSGRKKVLYCVITKYEVRELREVIDSVDHSAFVSISDVSEIIGNHVKSTGATLASA